MTPFLERTKSVSLAEANTAGVSSSAFAGDSSASTDSSISARVSISLQFLLYGPRTLDSCKWMILWRQARALATASALSSWTSLFESLPHPTLRSVLFRNFGNVLRVAWSAPSAVSSLSFNANLNTQVGVNVSTSGPELLQWDVSNISPSLKLENNDTIVRHDPASEIKWQCVVSSQVFNFIFIFSVHVRLNVMDFVYCI